MEARLPRFTYSVDVDNADNKEPTEVLYSRPAHERKLRTRSIWLIVRTL